jgi:hypothetical protein
MIQYLISNDIKNPFEKIYCVDFVPQYIAAAKVLLQKCKDENSDNENKNYFECIELEENNVLTMKPSDLGSSMFVFSSAATNPLFILRTMWLCKQQNVNDLFISIASKLDKADEMNIFGCNYKRSKIFSKAFLSAEKGQTCETRDWTRITLNKLKLSDITQSLKETIIAAEKRHFTCGE